MGENILACKQICLKPRPMAYSETLRNLKCDAFQSTCYKMPNGTVFAYNFSTKTSKSTGIRLFKYLFKFSEQNRMRCRWTL